MADDEDLVARALEQVEESFIAASGPGGQNVNKVATAVQLRLDVFALRLEPAVFQRLKALAGSRMTARGEIVLTAARRTDRAGAGGTEEAREEPGEPGRQGAADQVEEGARHGQGQPRPGRLVARPEQVDG